jgi:hypothetical protein
MVLVFGGELLDVFIVGGILCGQGASVKDLLLFSEVVCVAEDGNLGTEFVPAEPGQWVDDSIGVVSLGSCVLC